MKKLFAFLAVAGLLVAIQPGALARAGCCPGLAATKKSDEAKSAKADVRSACSTEVKKSDCSDKKDCSDEAKEECKTKTECDGKVTKSEDQSKG